MSDAATCRSCHTPIRWAITEGNHKRIPLDIEPTADGNIVETGDIDAATKAPIVRYLKKAERPTMFPSLALMVGGQTPDSARYVSHFATCPNADEHRKK